MSSIRGFYKFNKYLRLRDSKFESFYQRFSSKDSKIEIEISKSGTTKLNVPHTVAKTTPSQIEITSDKDAVFKSDISALPQLIIEKEKVVDNILLDEVPGPKLLQKIAKICSFIPIFGNQITTSTIQYMLSANSILGSQLTWGRNARLFRWLLNEYGPVVRLQGPFGGNVIILSRPEDALSVFQSEGKYPIRSNLDCIEKYRLNHRQFKHAGPFLMSGEEWEKLRKQITESLNNSTQYQFKRIELVCSDFVNHINKIKNKQDEVPPTFNEDISKWALESLCSVILGQKIIFKDGVGESARFINAFLGATDAIKRCESGLHFWKYFETPAWKTLVKNCDALDGILGKYLNDAEESIKNKNNTFTMNKKDMPLIEALLLHEEMLPDDILTIFLDMILVGVNAVSHSMAFLLYHLARNPKAQRILTEEISKAPQYLSVEELSKMKYLKACIKESLRLKPPIPVLSRILTKDTIISNYSIPKGTVVLMATYLSSTREEHFEDALKFIPERWFNSESNTLDAAIACIPFGYGPKSCLAKNLAEMQLCILIIKILRKYKIQYHYGDINSVNKLLAHPDRPLKFRFVNQK